MSVYTENETAFEEWQARQQLLKSDAGRFHVLCQIMRRAMLRNETPEECLRRLMKGIPALLPNLPKGNE